MTTEKKAKAAKYAREKTNKEWKMVRIRNDIHTRLKATGKSINMAISDALDNQKV